MERFAGESLLLTHDFKHTLDKKKSSYVLIWEDETFLSGNSFYLPGSVNDEDKQVEDWNNVPPPLSLWSRSDFAAKHKKIAEKHYHLSRELGKSMDSNNVDWKSNNMEEDRGELNRAPESINVKIPEMTSDRQSPARSSPDDIYAVCTSISNTTPQRSHESVEASLPVITRTKSNLGKDIREPDSKVKGIQKSEETQNRPSSVRSSREGFYTVGPSPANTGQKPFEAFEPSYGVSMSHFDDGLAARYGFGGGYRMPDPPFMPDQFPMTPSTRNGPNEMMFDYSNLDRGVDPREYSQGYGGHLDPMLAPPPPNLMDNSFPMQQRYAPHFDQMNYQRMSSFPPQPPMQPSGHNLFDPHGFPLQPPPPSDFEMSPMGFAPGPNYPYVSRSGGWIND